MERRSRLDKEKLCRTASLNVLAFDENDLCATHRLTIFFLIPSVGEEGDRKAIVPGTFCYNRDQVQR
jgi:hypothetical protein